MGHLDKYQSHWVKVKVTLVSKYQSHWVKVKITLVRVKVTFHKGQGHLKVKVNKLYVWNFYPEVDLRLNAFLLSFEFMTL